MEVTTVFLVRFGHGDFASIDNIFSTREKAEKRVDEMNHDSYYFGDDPYVDEWVVK